MTLLVGSEKSEFDFIENYKRINKLMGRGGQATKPVILPPKMLPVVIKPVEPEPEPVQPKLRLFCSKGGQIISYAPAFFPPGGDWWKLASQRYIDTTVAPPKAVTVLSIVKEVAAKYNVRVEDILSERRSSDIMLPRHISMWRAKQETPFSIARIASVYTKDHTSVLHAIKRIDRLLEEGKLLPSDIK